MSEWYVFRHDSDPLGPLATESVAEAILKGTFAPDVWVAPPGGPRWLRALDVPVIAQLVDGVATRPRHRDSGLRLMPGGFSTTAHGEPEFGATMMVVRDDELLRHEPPATTKKALRDTEEMTSLPAMSVRVPPHPDDDDASPLPPTPLAAVQPSSDRALPPPSTPVPPTGRMRNTAAAESEDLRRRRNG